MVDTIFRVASVISDIDPDKLGRIQVRVLPEMKDVKDDELPWAMPLALDTEHRVPKIGEQLYVYIETPFWSNFWYVNETPWSKTKYPFAKMKAELKVADYVPEYPQPSFVSYPSGSYDFEDEITGAMGFMHKSGTYVYFDKDGKLDIMYTKSFKIHDKDNKYLVTMDTDADEMVISGKNITITADKVKVKAGGDFVALFTPLAKILKKLLTHIHISPGPGPTGPALEGSQTPLSALSADIDLIKSTVMKTD